MTFAFDLVSDLHVDTWNTEIDWSGLATSPYCIVAGGIARDPTQLVAAMMALGQAYSAVFYIDGYSEHADSLENLGASYNDLATKLNRIPNVVFLHDSVVVINGVGIVGTNGWWGFDLDSNLDIAASAQWWREKTNASRLAAQNVSKWSINDATYLNSTIKKLQKHCEVTHLICVTHTVPRLDLVDHDLSLSNSHAMNCIGNSYMKQVLKSDLSKKIHTWCFGHYYGAVDQIIDNVRYVNNCRGKQNSVHHRKVFFPRRIEIGD